jgi:hypothetical protein
MMEVVHLISQSPGLTLINGQKVDWLGVPLDDLSDDGLTAADR